MRCSAAVLLVLCLAMVPSTLYINTAILNRAFYPSLYRAEDSVKRHALDPMLKDSAILSRQYDSALKKTFNDALFTLDNVCADADRECVKSFLRDNYAKVRNGEYDQGDCMAFVDGLDLGMDSAKWCRLHYQGKALTDYVKVAVLESEREMQELDIKYGSKLTGLMTGPFTTQSITRRFMSTIYSGVLLSTSGIISQSCNSNYAYTSFQDSMPCAVKYEAFFRYIDAVNGAQRCLRRERIHVPDLPQYAQLRAAEDMRQEMTVSLETDSPVEYAIHANHARVLQEGILWGLNSTKATPVTTMHPMSRFVLAAESMQASSMFVRGALGRSGRLQQTNLILSQMQRKMLSCPYTQNLSIDEFNTSTIHMYVNVKNACGIGITDDEKDLFNSRVLSDPTLWRYPDNPNISTVYDEIKTVIEEVCP
jgi:hypothetical protein